MSSGGAVGAVVAVIAAKKREEILAKFREKGALSPSTALTREELGLGSNPVFRLQDLEGTVVGVEGGRYFLDEEAVARQNVSHQRLAAALFIVLVLMVLFVVFRG